MKPPRISILFFLPFTMKFGLCLRFTKLPFTEVDKIVNKIASKIRMEMTLDYFEEDGDIMMYAYPPQEGPTLLYHRYWFTTIERAVELFNEFYEREVVKSVRKPDPGKRPIRWHKRIF